MRWGLVLEIARKELLETLRDRRSLLMLLVVPALLYPLMLISFTKVATTQAETREAQPSRVAVWGALPEALERDLLAEEPGLVLVPWAGCPAAVRSDLLAGRVAPPPAPEPASAGRGPKVARVRMGPADDVAPADDPLALAARGALAPAEDVGAAAAIDAVLVPARDLPERLAADALGRVVVYHDSVDEGSRQARERVLRGLQAVRTRLVAARVAARGLPQGFARALDASALTVTSAARRSGQRLGALLPFVLIVMSLMGGFYASIDLTAGEKERGTLQTLLCAPLDPAELILGKFATVWAMTLLAGLTNIASLAATLWRILPADQVEVGPGALAQTFLLFVPVSFTTSAVFLAVGAFARDFKDGQNFVTPVYLALAMPSGFTVLPGVELSLWTALVPILNIALLIKGILVGDAPPDLVFLVLAASALYAALALALAARVFQREQVLLGGGEPLRVTLGLERRPGGTPTPLLALLLFVVVLVTVFYGSRLLEDRGLPALLLGTQALMLVPTLLTVRGLALAPGPSLGLRRPTARSLVAAAVIGASAWTVAAGLLLRLLPPPEGVARALEALVLLDGAPLWVALVVVGLVPAVVEELLFRGFVLGGLRRLGPVAAVGVSAVLFGLAHASLYRMLPTAFLGVVLGAVRWRTGSVVPSIVVHALNNGLACLLARTPDAPAWLRDADGLPWPVTAGGALVLAAGLGLLWTGAPAVEDDRAQDGRGSRDRGDAAAVT